MCHDLLNNDMSSVGDIFLQGDVGEGEYLLSCLWNRWRRHTGWPTFRWSSRSNPQDDQWISSTIRDKNQIIYTGKSCPRVGMKRRLQSGTPYPKYYERPSTRQETQIHKINQLHHLIRWEDTTLKREYTIFLQGGCYSEIPAQYGALIITALMFGSFDGQKRKGVGIMVCL